MICYQCQGKRHTLEIRQGERFQKTVVLVPCPLCRGLGHLHCCEGDQAQPRKQHTYYEGEESDACAQHR